MYPQIARFMGPTWGPPGSCRPQMGLMLAPWTLLSGPSSYLKITPRIQIFFEERATFDKDILLVLNYELDVGGSGTHIDLYEKFFEHYNDVIMGTMASQIASLTSVYSTVYSGVDKSKHQSSASLAFVWGIHRGPVNSPHKWPVTRKMFPFDDVIMICIMWMVS